MSADEAPWRRDTLGGSDAPALVGVDPFKTAGDIWCEKTGRLPVFPDEDSPLDPRSLGKAIGPLLVAYAARGRPVAPEVWYQHPSAPMACSVDGLCVDDGLLIEAKTTGLLGHIPEQYAHAYGEDGTDEVPEAVQVQVHHAFAVLDAQPNLPPIRMALVPALIGGRGIRCYRIERNDALVADLVHLERAWWEDYVVADRCPADDPPSLETLRHMLRRSDAPPRVVDTTFVAEWLQAKAILKRATENEETLRRLILAELGDAEVGECDLGRLTYRPVHRAAYMVAASVYRSLRFTQTRERKVA